MAVHQVYILYSPSLDTYYTGQSEAFEERLKWHLEHLFPGSYTKRAADWQIVLTIDCISRKQAVNLEAHIKRMKSRRYIENLRRYPEIIRRLQERYAQ